MNRTYHDFLEAVYNGEVEFIGEGGAHYKMGTYRENPEAFDTLSDVPSFHFGDMFSRGGIRFDDESEEQNAWNECPALMDEQGREKAAFVSELAGGQVTLISGLHMTLAVEGVTLMTAYYQDLPFNPQLPFGRWVTFKGDATAIMGPTFIQLAYASLTALGAQGVEYVVRDPNLQMAALAKARRARGKVAPPDMLTIHLTKKVNVGGVSFGGERGTHASPKPHDREGHWRHSEREIPDWEEVEPTTGEYAGMTVWRKWIKTAAIKGGKPKDVAPQYRVVK